MLKYAKRLKLKHFRGVFMLDELSGMSPKKQETGIINHDTTRGRGTHWTAYSKTNDQVVYYDSFGFRPPPEVTRYFRGSQMVYSNLKEQSYDASNCGHLCLRFLLKEAEKRTPAQK